MARMNENPYEAPQSHPPERPARPRDTGREGCILFSIATVVVFLIPNTAMWGSNEK
jgi:hypothetical protein